MRSFSFLIFVALAFCCWGTYGPVLHIGQEAMGADGQLSSLRPFICVGIAYFMIAVLFPLIVLLTRGETGKWTLFGSAWSFAAGAVGAIGALGIIFAFKFQGKPVYVMPLVFGCAPIVNTFVTMAMARTFRQASLIFYVGIIIVAIGAAGVLTFKPTAPKKSAERIESQVESVSESQIIPVVFSSQAENKSTNSPADQTAVTSTKPSVAKTAGNMMMIVHSVIVTAICWGAYGPVLHKGQTQMGGSRLRPFLCVGLAYFAIAVVVPYFLLPFFPEPGGWNTTGTVWSLMGGAVGAIGALGIIYAFNFGGKPIFVMPLVFGFAPVVNTFVETISKGMGQASPYFYASLLMVIVGAVMVLVFAPKAAPHKPADNVYGKPATH